MERHRQGPVSDEGQPWAARWYVWPEGSARAKGPMTAPELAYGIYSGRIRRRDLAINGRTGARYVVGDHPSLSAWLTPSRDRSARLFRAALRLARARSEAEGRPVEACLPSWANDLLDDEQREAYRTLEVHPATAGDALARRYRALALEHHPDRGGDPGRMGAINRAFAALRELAVA